MRELFFLMQLTKKNSFGEKHVQIGFPLFGQYLVEIEKNEYLKFKL